MAQTVRQVASSQQAGQTCRWTSRHQALMISENPSHHQMTALCTHALSQTSQDESRRNSLAKLAVAAVQEMYGKHVKLTAYMSSAYKVQKPVNSEL